jgi:alanine racemase
MAVVKANAYGHGSGIVAPAIRDQIDWLGVDSLSEALTIVALELARPILILGHTDREDAETIVRHDLRPVVFRLDLAESLSRAAQRMGRTARVHLEIETGLHRLGVPHERAGAFGSALRRLPGVVVEGVYTHFADVETPDSTLVPLQLRRFRAAVEAVRKAGHEPSLVHASPSAGALLHPQEELNMARVGIGLYGIWPSEATRRVTTSRHPDLVLLPALRWTSRLAQVERVPAGDTVGYDLTYTAKSERLIGVVPVGYADGYDRKLSNRAHVLVRGKKAPVVGMVAMNMMMVDVTESRAQYDDEVILVGEQNGESVTLDDLARWSETIPYEVAARLSPLLARRIV